MPTLKTDILGSQIEINYEESEHKKLLRLISAFKKRLNEFSNNNGRISNNTILFLAALKSEDQLEEVYSLVDKMKKDKNILIEQKNIIEKLSKEIVFLNDKINKLNTVLLSQEKNNSHAKEEIIKLEKILQIIQKKILSKNDDRN